MTDHHPPAIPPGTPVFDAAGERTGVVRAVGDSLHVAADAATPVAFHVPAAAIAVYDGSRVTLNRLRRGLDVTDAGAGERRETGEAPLGSAGGTSAGAATGDAFGGTRVDGDMPGGR